VGGRAVPCLYTKYRFKDITSTESWLPREGHIWVEAPVGKSSKLGEKEAHVLYALAGAV